MIEFLFDNAGTIIVSVILIALISVAIAGMVRNKKKGKSSCGCSCGLCPNSGMCHKK